MKWVILKPAIKSTTDLVAGTPPAQIQQSPSTKEAKGAQQGRMGR